MYQQQDSYEEINFLIEKESAAIDAPKIWVTFVQFDSVPSERLLVLGTAPCLSPHLFPRSHRDKRLGHAGDKYPPITGNLYPSDQRRNGGLRRTVFLPAPYLEYLTGEICDKGAYSEADRHLRSALLSLVPLEIRDLIAMMFGYIGGHSLAFSIIPKPFFLYRMGHSGNVSSREQLSRTFDIAHGRVVLCTACVLKAILEIFVIMNAINLPAKALQREKIPRIRWMRGRNREMGSWWLMAPSFPLPFIYYQKKEFLR